MESNASEVAPEARDCEAKLPMKSWHFEFLNFHTFSLSTLIQVAFFGALHIHSCGLCENNTKPRSFFGGKNGTTIPLVPLLHQNSGISQPSRTPNAERHLPTKNQTIFLQIEAPIDVEE